jgi:uncharacterized repeat protein (TIGR01451 family)
MASFIFTKSANTTNANIGDIITYTISLTNVSGGPAIQIFDTLMATAGTTFMVLSVSAPGFAVNIGPTSQRITGNLTVGNTVIVTIMVEVLTGTDGGMITNTATYNSNDLSTACANWEVTIGEVVPPHDFTITKANTPSAPMTVNPGGLIVSTITITNNNLVPTTDATLTDTIPTNTTFLFAAPITPNIITPTLLTWSPLILPVGTTVLTVVSQVNLGTPNGTLLTDTANLSIPSGGEDPPFTFAASATTQVFSNIPPPPIPSADLSITISDPVDPIDLVSTRYNNYHDYDEPTTTTKTNTRTLEYLITLRNNGPSSAENVIFVIDSQILPLQSLSCSSSSSCYTNTNWSVMIQQIQVVGIGTGFILPLSSSTTNFPLSGSAAVVLPNTIAIFKLTLKFNDNNKCQNKIITKKFRGDSKSKSNNNNNNKQLIQIKLLASVKSLTTSDLNLSNNMNENTTLLCID